MVVGGLYERATFSRSGRSWPLSAKRSRMNFISFCSRDSDEQILYARQSSDLKVAMVVLGCWQELGLIVMFVLEGFL